ncbi:MAG: hypothetical protein APR63_10415 [Desulfuromonas sp. SDB]|nr:MAG: hypothetical protein APR63_10415 [Desulfuromonas sp. SDB]
MNKVIITSITGLGLWLICSTSLFSEPHRRGFILNFGMGTGYTHIYSKTGDRVRYDDELALGSDFRIGWAPTDQYQLYYTHKLTLFDLDDLFRKSEELQEENPFAFLILPFLPFAYSHNCAGLGMTYFFKPQAPSFYVDGGFGMTIFPNRQIEEVQAGGSVFWGGGYEITPHLTLGCEMMWGFASDDDQYSNEERTTSNAFSAIVTINFLLY